MSNPAFDFRETEGQADGTDAAEGQDTKSELGDGDGDTGPETGDGDPSTGDGDGEPTTGDGDGEPTTGDGDGEPTTGDGDGDPTTGDGDGDPTTGDGDGDGDPTGDGDGDPILLDMMMIPFCPGLEFNDACQFCAGEHCCSPGVETCFDPGIGCGCILNCMADQQGDLSQCGDICGAAEEVVLLTEQFSSCMDINCNNFCI